MLYLRSYSRGDGACAERVPIAEVSALGLERALLAADAAARERELATTLARDPALMTWAENATRSETGDTIGVGSAVAALAPRLEIELAESLEHSANGQRSTNQPTGVESRLPALAQRLADCSQTLADFDARLERAKLDAMKELAYGASHEINNPLANIAARAQTLLEGEADAERRRKLVAIHRQAMRAHEMIADLMLFARPPKLKRGPCNLAEIAHVAINELSQRAAEQGTRLQLDAADCGVIVSADATQLAVAVQAVGQNALEAVDEGGHVHILVRRSEPADEEWGEISIRDDGPGIPADVREHLFDPFFSGREAGRGLGFGLCKCWRIVNEHGGQVTIQRPAEGGAEISIQLPLMSRVGATATCS
jgi:signal transduction histidine kinase